MNQNQQKNSLQRTFATPNVVISKCLEFDACRYNGHLISDDFVKALQKHVNFIPVCPEVEIGLGIPRDPIRIVANNGNVELRQLETGQDLTEKMKSFSQSYLTSLTDVDGFILKSRSPSCGPRDVKVYSEKSMPKGKRPGFFAQEVLDKYPQLAIEDEGRLRNFNIREHFLTKLFTLVSFREAKEKSSISSLVDFHSDNKLLLMSYNQTALRALGKIVANHAKKDVMLVFKEYEHLHFHALSRAPKYTSNINVLMHALGYFSKRLSKSEKAFFLDALEKYRSKRIPLSACLGVLKSWIIRFGEDYLERQTYFEPYPEDLVEISDSGKGRNLN